MITVLVLASSPIDQGPLRLGKEEKVIRHSWNSASNRDQFRVISCTATTVDDLRNYMLTHNPTVVHFSGHGGGSQGLCFEDDQGRTHPVNGDRLAKLFHLVQEDVKCVVLNACFSEVQAKAISEHIDFVIGMKDEIGDPAAIKFSQGFYEAVWAGRDFEKAFKFGCSAIDTANIPEEHIPVILKSPRLGGLRLEYSEDTQRIENFILQYINSETEDRAKLTTQGEACLQKMIESKKGSVPRKYSSVSVLSVGSVSEGYKEVRCVFRSGLQSGEHTFYIKPAGESFLLDWEATAGWWPISPTTYKALGSNKEIVVRAIAQLDDYFNYDFDQRNFVSISLGHIDGGNLHGYIHRRHEDVQDLVRYLYDGQPHRIIVEIVPGNEDMGHVHISEFVSESWVLFDEE